MEQKRVYRYSTKKFCLNCRGKMRWDYKEFCSRKCLSEYSFIKIKQQKKDNIRTKELRAKGFRVIRLWETDIHKLNLNKFEKILF